MTALEVSGLTAGYGKANVLHGVSLTVKQGAIVSLVGPNGAGKTTLLMALAGLLPASGSISYFGKSLATVGVEDRVARGLCLVPEKRELFGDMSVGDNLELGGFNFRNDAAKVRQRMDGVFAMFPRLSERSNKD